MADWFSRLNETMIAGNELWRIGAFFLAMLAGLLGGKMAHLAASRSADSLQRRGRELAGVALRSIARVFRFAGFIIGFKIGFSLLNAGPDATVFAKTLFGVFVSLAVGYTAYSLVDVVDHWLIRLMSRQTGNLGEMVRPMVRASLRITVVVLTLLQIAQILTDKPLTSILAGLGVGGLAVALAAQDTVKNFFGSLVIFADKPFLVGDRIIVDNTDGVVEQVGFRSTRIRTLEGSLVTIPNGELANKAIQNIGQRPFIRRTLNLSIPYSSSPEKIQRALEILRELLANHEGMKPELPPRVLFNDFAPSSLNILVMYWYHPPDFWAFQAFNERINLRIFERFTAEGIEFAFPTQTVHVVNTPGSSRS
ncbi:MAG: mechanosensitive ion channel family protein [Kiritimatiellae bacterium]|nr:mechanosensitive ion channel family protein [Kiritimatiellia bacterium]MDW8457988.1 mechanosensitive ion channel family protein [Verrucomicrobiota bacterium]